MYETCTSGTGVGLAEGLPVGFTVDVGVGVGTVGAAAPGAVP